MSPRNDQNIHNEVVRRMTAQHTPNKPGEPTEEVEGSSEEGTVNSNNPPDSDSEGDSPPIELIMSPRLVGTEPEYHGLFGIMCTSEEECTILRNDRAFLGKLDLDNCTQFGISAAMQYLNQSSYIFNGFSVGNDHPYGFTANVQTHLDNNPTYNCILHSTPDERKLWDEVMVKELKSLGELGSLKMVKRPRGGDILQSTWAFKKKWYPDGGLKKHKAHFCVCGDQHIDGVHVF